MIRFIRSVRPRNSRRREAVAWAKEVSAYISQTYGVGPVEVYAERFGASGTIYWMVDFADLGAADAFSQRLRADATYAALVARGNPLMVDGSNHDLVLSLL